VMLVVDHHTKCQEFMLDVI